MYAGARRLAADGPLPRPQDPLFQALNSSIAFDYRLAPYDLEQSLAHARMLARSGIITADDLDQIERGLAAVREEIEEDRFVVEPDDEDMHMAIERRLTEIAGPVGGKLHTARSRNDQVATDVAMLVRAHSLERPGLLRRLMDTLVELAERHLDWPLPGYTHLQRAQPVYLSHHLLAYFWKFRRDLQRFKFCMTATDDLPLGRGRAGRGQLRYRAGCSWPRSWASAASPRTRSTRSPTATSCSTTCPPPPPAPATCRSSAARSCCGRARSSASARCPTPSRRARA